LRGIETASRAASIGLQYVLDQASEFALMGDRRLSPPLVLVDLMKEQLSESILPLLGHLLQALDGLF
jgi:hypothetical protein